MQPAAVRWFQGKNGSSAYGISARCSLVGSNQVRQRLPGQPPDLQRALDALAVVGCQARGRGRVDAGQLLVHRRPADGARLRVQLLARGGVGGWQLGHAVAQGPEVQQGAAHEQGQRAARLDLGDEPRGIVREFRGRVRLVRVADIDQMVRHGGEFVGTGLGRADVHAAVDQRRVHADDFHRQSRRQRARQCQGRCRLAAGRGSGEGQNRRRRAGWGWRCGAHGSASVAECSCG